MQIYIANKLVEGPYGGGNQFLKSLRSEFIRAGIYCEDPHRANIVLFNSHQNLEEVSHLKQDNLKAIFVHRLDGPMRLYNNMSDQRDMMAYQMNTAFANAVIFQSEWSKQANLKLGLDIGDKNNVVVHNAVNSSVFKKNPNRQRGNKIRLITSSWSDNIKKGFLTYKYLDENLDFDNYELVFMGRSPVKFKNILNLGPLNTENVVKELKRSDIYITASENDPCSNSLIEALSCGLPALALNSGGHSELVKSGGLLFFENKEIINKLGKICDNYSEYKRNIRVDSIDAVSKKYIEFFKISL